MTTAPRVTVVIPAFNEERRLPATLAAVSDYFTRQQRDFSIIVVDDGSTDGTAGVARLAAKGIPLELISLPGNRGKGFTIRQGIKAATGELVLLTDADLSTPVTEFPKLEAAVRSGAGLAIGSRTLAGANVLVRQPWYRQTAGRIFNLMIRATLTGRFRDTQCGFKLMTAACAAAVLPHLTVAGFAYDVELVLAAQHLGFAVEEVPVTWTNSPESKVRFVPDSLMMARDLAAIRLRAWTGFKPAKG